MSYEKSFKIEKSYAKIVSDISEVILVEEEFLNVKNNFEKIVDSPRDFINITNLAELIDVLDKRDEIGPYNIENFFIIAENDHFNHLKPELHDHARELMKVIADEPHRIVKLPCGNFEFDCTHDVFPEKAVALLSQNLQERWKVVAERLQISPEDICKIDAISRNYETKIRQMLRIYTTNIKCSTKRGRLLNVLAQIRKNSLRIQLQNIFMNYRE